MEGNAAENPNVVSSNNSFVQSTATEIGEIKMLNVIFGKIENVVYNTSLYFKNVYDRDWLLIPEIQEMIRDIDNSEVIGGNAVNSPVMGIIPPTSLSGGVKTLILINQMQDKIFNASNCGDNCASWLLKIGRSKDITVNLRHVMDFGEEKFDIHVLNTDEIVHDSDRLAEIAGRYV